MDINFQSKRRLHIIPKNFFVFIIISFNKILMCICRTIILNQIISKPELKEFRVPGLLELTPDNFYFLFLVWIHSKIIFTNIYHK